MTKDLVWIAVPLVGFCLGLLPKPRTAFIVLGICAVVVAAYAQRLVFGVVLLGGGIQWVLRGPLESETGRTT